MNVNELPQYKCHKVVRAGVICSWHSCGFVSVEIKGTDTIIEVEVGQKWIEKHNPESGGYLVVYEDGYTSYSPAAAFEAGYTLVEVGTSCGGAGGDDDFPDNKEMQEAGKYTSGADWALEGQSAFVNKAAQVPLSHDLVKLEAAEFSDALMWLKEGKRVQRAGWNGASQYVSLLVPHAPHPEDSPDAFPLNPYFKMWDNNAQADGTFTPFLILKNAQNKIFPWFPSMGDLLATDWQVYEAPKPGRSS